MREHCLEQLVKAVQDNTTSSVDQIAVLMEYEIFCSAKSSQGYKLQIHKKVCDNETQGFVCCPISCLMSIAVCLTQCCLLCHAPGG